MADHTHIEWTDATWNPITGCSVVSPGCTNCYAMRLAGTRLRHHPSRAGLTTNTKAGPVWTGEVRLNRGWLDQPLRWKKPRRIFVCAHGDLFHESVPDAWIDQVFATITLAHQHIFQVLTKRSARQRKYMSDPATPGRIARVIVDLWLAGHVKPDEHWPVITIGHPEDPDDLTISWPRPNVWAGVSVEDQTRADERILDVLETPAAVRWISAEPLLRELHIGWALSRNRLEIGAGFLRRGRFSPGLETLRPIDWVVVGGESGPGARPMHPDWARQVRDQCADAGVPFLFKQWGEWTPGENVECQRGSVETADWFDEGWLFSEENLARTDGHIDDEPDLYRVGKRAAGRRLDGVIHDAMPGAI